MDKQKEAAMFLLIFLILMCYVDNKCGAALMCSHHVKSCSVIITSGPPLHALISADIFEGIVFTECKRRWIIIGDAFLNE